MDNPRSPRERSPRQRLARRLAIDLAIMTVVGLMLALIGPFGSFGDPLAIRLAVWLGLAYAGYAIYAPVGVVVDRLHATLELPRWGLWVAGVMLATVPMAVLVWSIAQINSTSYRLPGGEEALLYYFYVLVIGGGVTLLFNVIQREEPAPPAATRMAEARTAGPGGEGSGEEKPTRQDRPTDSAVGDALLDRLPPELGSEIIALEMEDHYVRVHTMLGNDLVLMRMRDAVHQLAAIEGMRVHRSWWVARDAVEDVRREGRSLRLRLAGGIEAPVSRANIQPLKDAGWI